MDHAMTFGALRYRLSHANPRDVGVSAWSGVLTALVSGKGPVAYLVPEETLGQLRSHAALVNDRGHKHPSRALATILLGQPRVPLIQAAFKSGRQVNRSLRTLLDRATRRRERKSYVIGVSRRIFDEAAARAGVELDATLAASDGPTDHIEFDPEEVPPVLEEKLTGNSSEIRFLRQLVVKAARNDEPILVLGDTGTGKEVVARAIHHLHPTRQLHPFQAVNCGAIPRELFESEVFGYVDGAFTHARRGGSNGLWRAAAGGTLFLDEIGDLALEHQVKILRALEGNRIRPVGASKEAAVDARVVAATNRDLRAMVQSGEFREDLLYRFGMRINLPPLCDRPQDIAPLAKHLWNEIAPRRPPLSEAVLTELTQYRWRGNARELRSILVNLHIYYPKTAPTVRHVQFVLRMQAPHAATESANGSDVALQQFEYLRHLRRARTAIDTCQRLVRAHGRSADGADWRRRFQAEIFGCLTELQLLGTRPEQFRNLDTFQTIHSLAGGLAAYRSLLERDENEALRYGQKDLTRAISTAATATRRDEERIVKAL